MIGRLRGIIIEKQPPLVLLEVGGVGYEVHMPMTCFYELPEIGKEAVVFTQFVVREDASFFPFTARIVVPSRHKVSALISFISLQARTKTRKTCFNAFLFSLRKSAMVL